MAKHKLLDNATVGGRKRWKIYLAIFLILAGIVVATLITIGIIGQEQFDAWVVQVGITVTALFGLAGTLLALLNPEKRQDRDPLPGPRDHVM